MKKGTAYKIRTITCQHCEQKVTDRMPAKRRFCSLECYRASKPQNRKNGEVRPCEWCGKETYFCKSRLSAKNFFCCADHANQWQGRNKAEFACKTCGVAFRVSKSFIQHGNPTYCSLACRDADPDQHARLIEMNKAQQGKTTEIERIGYALLNELGIDYKPQFLIGGKFCVDAFCPALNLVVQFDGDYWHANPLRFSEPDTRQRKRMALDASQDKYMAACGYQVVRFWESDIKKNLESVRQRLIKAAR